MECSSSLKSMLAGDWLTLERAARLRNPDPPYHHPADINQSVENSSKNEHVGGYNGNPVIKTNGGIQEETITYATASQPAMSAITNWG